MLHDEENILEVNPAVVRILGFRGADEMIGKHPADLSASIQLNGERADVLARKCIEECMTNGCIRFEWISLNSSAEEIPIEVNLNQQHRSTAG